MLSLICILIIQSTAIDFIWNGAQANLLGRDSVVLANNYQVADITNSTYRRNTTQVSVISVTPQVSTAIVTGITTRISATTAAVSISTTGGQQDYYVEVIMVIVIAGILGAIVFARRNRPPAPG